MKIVVDTNILISTLIQPKGKIGTLLMNDLISFPVTTSI